MIMAEPGQDNLNRYRAILIDLDGTLLDIDLLKFITSYIPAVAPAFKDFVSSDFFGEHLLGATRTMIENVDATLTNEQVFFSEFCSRLRQPYHTLKPIFNRFYKEEFHKLQNCSKPKPDAPAVLKAARRRGLKVILATNPIFPLSAVEQRLAWGGLDSSQFDLITSIENMHFCKPRPGYYMEISAMIGCSPGQCLMAGNDVEEDLVASVTGMDTFLVEDQLLNLKGIDPVCSYRGTLGDLAAFLEEAAPAT